MMPGKGASSKCSVILAYLHAVRDWYIPKRLRYDQRSRLSRHVQPAICSDVCSATNTLRVIPRSQSNSAIITHAQATTRPDQNGPRRRLTHNALRSAFSHALSSSFPCSCSLGSCLGFGALREDELLKVTLFIFFTAGMCNRCARVA